MKIEVEHQDLVDLHWMARRYASGRKTHAPLTFNAIVKRLLAVGVTLQEGSDGTLWADDE